MVSDPVWTFDPDRKQYVATVKFIYDQKMFHPEERLEFFARVDDDLLRIQRRLQVVNAYTGPVKDRKDETSPG